MKLLNQTQALATVRRNALAPASESCLALLNEYLKDSEHRGLAKTTHVRYSQICKDFFLHAGGLRPSEIRPRDIREFLEWRMNLGASNYTLHQELCALRSLFRFAEAMEIVAVSPARSIQTRRYHRKLPRLLTEEQVNKLIDSANTLRDKALLTTMYGTGARLSEIATMRVEELSWSAKTIMIHGKGNKERLVPLGTKAMELLKQYLGDRKTGWLFQAEGHRDQKGSLVRSGTGWWLGVWRDEYAFSSNGKLCWHVSAKRIGRLSEMTKEQARAKLTTHLAGILHPRPRPIKDEPMRKPSIQMIVRKAGMKAGIGHVHPHMLRHSFATHLLDHGADMLSISKFLGHVNLTTTAIYTHVSQAKMQDTLEKFHPHWR